MEKAVGKHHLLVVFALWVGIFIPMHKGFAERSGHTSGLAAAVSLDKHAHPLSIVRGSELPQHKLNHDAEIVEEKEDLDQGVGLPDDTGTGGLVFESFDFSFYDFLHYAAKIRPVTEGRLFYTYQRRHILFRSLLI